MMNWPNNTYKEIKSVTNKLRTKKICGQYWNFCQTKGHRDKEVHLSFALYQVPCSKKEKKQQVRNENPNRFGVRENRNQKKDWRASQ